jgi:hypothetical protein
VPGGGVGSLVVGGRVFSGEPVPGKTRVRKDQGVPTLRIAEDDAADDLLGRDPLALLIGMLLDQRMRRRSSGPSCRDGVG